MKVLLLQSKPFLPVLDGGNEASRALVKEIIELGHELNILTFSSEKHPFDHANFNVEPWNKLTIDHVPVQLKTTAVEALKAGIKRESYNLSRFTHPDWLKKINQFETDFDWVIIDSLYAGQEIETIRKKFPLAILVCRAHNVESQIWQIQALKEHSFIRRKYVSLLAKQLKKREKRILKQCDLILPISAEDKKKFDRWRLKSVQLFPYFPDIEPTIHKNISSDFFFLGSMNWHPNVHAHNKLKNNILPYLLRDKPEVKMIFGGGSQDKITKMDSNQVEYVGFVQDKIKFLTESGILLAPIETGSGVRIKLVEALALGVPCVTSRKGAEGIEIKNGDGLFIANNDAEFLKIAEQLHDDMDLRAETASKAIENMKKWKAKYSLKSIFENHARF